MQIEIFGVPVVLYNTIGAAKAKVRLRAMLALVHLSRVAANLIASPCDRAFDRDDVRTINAGLDGRRGRAANGGR
jgi:hypothetical protein